MSFMEEVEHNGNAEGLIIKAVSCDIRPWAEASNRDVLRELSGARELTAEPEDFECPISGIVRRQGTGRQQLVLPLDRVKPEHISQ